jgi:hypothetical protein
MATPRKGADERSISRTYRAAIRIGEDFITLEETVTLPIDASDEEVTQAVELGMRIYRAQREAVEAQITTIRETASVPAQITVRDPDAPASDKQRNYIAALQEDLAWSNEQLAGYAGEQDVDLVTMTKGQASVFIDGLKKLAEDRTSYNGDGKGRAQSNGNGQAAPPATPVRANDGQPVNDKQIHALDRIAQQQGIDLDAETRKRYGVVAHGMTYEQASALLREWQRPAQRRTSELPF